MGLAALYDLFPTIATWWAGLMTHSIGFIAGALLFWLLVLVLFSVLVLAADKWLRAHTGDVLMSRSMKRNRLKRRQGP